MEARAGQRDCMEDYHNARAEPFQFPWIKASDPVSIILGAKPGDILKTAGHSETAGTYESYRYVI